MPIFSSRILVVCVSGLNWFFVMAIGNWKIVAHFLFALRFEECFWLNLSQEFLAVSFIDEFNGKQW